MSFGKYREALTYYAPNFTQNSTSKDYTPGWSTSGINFFAHVFESTGRESDVNDRRSFTQIIQIETHLNNIEWDNKARILYRGEYYYIESIQRFYKDNKVFITAEFTS